MKMSGLLLLTTCFLFSVETEDLSQKYPNDKGIEREIQRLSTPQVFVPHFLELKKLI